MAVPQELIASKIFLIRGKKVMLDRDLAELYEVPTKSLKLAVRRNIGRFPEDFMFQLTKEEFESLRFQFETSGRRGQMFEIPKWNIKFEVAKCDFKERQVNWRCQFGASRRGKQRSQNVTLKKEAFSC